MSSSEAPDTQPPEPSSSLSAEQEQERSDSEPQRRLYVLVVRDDYMESPQLSEFSNLRAGLRYMSYWLNKQRTGQFFGRIWAFYGQLVDYSTPLSKYRIKLDEQTFEISSLDDAEFMGHIGGPAT